MKTPDEIREFDEQQTEIRHQAELTHRPHADVEPERARLAEGYKVNCPICFGDYMALGFDEYR